MSFIAKPKCKVIKADWAWKEENLPKDYFNNLKSKRITAKQSKKQAKRAFIRKVHAARRTAKSIVGNLPLGNSNRDVANALYSMGKIKGGPFGKKAASKALVEWHESIPAKDRVRKVYANKNPAEFYESREWRELRYKALVNHGRQCQCCGASPPDVVLHVDHIKPRSLYPELELDIDNLQILCKDCNLGKSNKDDTDFRD